MKTALSKKKLKEFREILTQRMNKLIKEARDQMGNMTEIKETRLLDNRPQEEVAA